MEVFEYLEGCLEHGMLSLGLVGSIQRIAVAEGDEERPRGARTSSRQATLPVTRVSIHAPARARTAIE